jgi:hypothetical protein
MANDEMLGPRCPHFRPWSDCGDSGCKAILEILDSPAESFKRILRLHCQSVIDKNTTYRVAADEVDERGMPLTPEDTDCERSTPEDIQDENADVETEVSEKEQIDKKLKEEPLAHTPQLLQAMVRAGAITSAQRDVLELRLYGETWKEVGKILDITVRAARRLADPDRFGPSRPSDLVHGTVIGRRISGEKKVRYLKVRKDKFKNWERTLLEPISEPVAKPNIDPAIQKYVRQSPMRELYAALIGHFSRKGFRTPPPEVSAAEWKFNLKHAKRILLKNRRRLLGLSPLDIYRSLGRGKKLCPGCRTPILVGFRLGGELITRRKNYCDDICKKKAQRRAKDTAIKTASRPRPVNTL